MILSTFGCGAPAQNQTRPARAGNVSMNIPVSWTLDANGPAVLAASPDRREAVAVEAIVSPGRPDALSLLRSLVESGKVGPLLSPSILAIRGDAANAQALLRGRQGQAQALLAIRGGAATLYVAMAPEAQFRQRLPELVKALQSFSFAPENARPNQSTASGLRFVRVDEFNERAFSLEFPEGWRNQAGLYRPTPTDKRYESSAVSPDGAVTVFIGDRNLGSYVVPNQMMASLGFREGSPYSPAGTTVMTILRYLPGAQAAQYWLQNRLPGARALAPKDRPDLAQQIAAHRYRFGNALRATLHAGELDFEYQGKRGSVIAATEISGCEMNACMWNVPYLYGYFAAPGREAEAQTVLGHAWASARVNPEWWHKDARDSRISFEAAMETTRAINQIYKDTMAQRSESSDRINRVRGDLLSGTYRVLDPATNEHTTVQAGSNFYYRVNNTNTVIGTNIEQTPVDLTRMLILDWDSRP
jgi:hypothetical protein